MLADEVVHLAAVVGFKRRVVLPANEEAVAVAGVGGPRVAGAEVRVVHVPAVQPQPDAAVRTVVAAQPEEVRFCWSGEEGMLIVLHCN